MAGREGGGHGVRGSGEGWTGVACTIIVAPGIGSPFASVTDPLSCVCANPKATPIRTNNSVT